MTQIADVMTPGPLPIDSQQTLAEALHRMEGFPLRHLPIIDGGRLAGITSEAAILRYLATNREADPQRALVTLAMSDVFTVTPDAPVMAVARTMVERRLDAAVIVAKGRIAGIFTTTDALRVIAEREPERAPSTAPSRWPRRILCAVDFSAGSRHAAEVALDLARASGATVTLFHAFDLPSTPEEAAHVESVALARLNQESERSLRELREDLDHADGPTISVAHGIGDAAGTIARHARDHGFDLIVAGTHGRTGLQRVLLGSVAEKVARHAPCPVLVVRDAAAAAHR